MKYAHEWAEASWDEQRRERERFERDRTTLAVALGVDPTTVSAEAVYRWRHERADARIAEKRERAARANEARLAKYGRPCAGVEQPGLSL